MKALDPYLGFFKAAAILAVCLAIFYAGTRVNESKWLKRQAKAVETALDGERDLVAQSNQWTSDYIVRLQSQLRSANALPKITLVNDCPVPAAVGGLLNDAQRMHTNAGARSNSESASTTADSTCSAELNICKRNYAEVCMPNAQQLTEIQERWERTRLLVNDK